MPTIASGASTQITLAADQSLLVMPGGSGIAALSGGQQSGVSYRLGTSQVTIGPFTQAQLVSVSADRAVEYFVQPTQSLANPPGEAVSASPDGVISDVRLNALASGAGNGLRTVLIGHSYLDQESDTFTYNRPIFNLNGTVNWMNFFLGWPLEIVKAHAIGGERLIDLEDRIDAALSETADLAIWNIGINDLKETKNSGNSRFTGKAYAIDPQQRNLAYCIGKATTLLKKIADKYQRVIILPETSPANGAGDQIKQLAARTAQYNRALQRLASSDARMLYIPLDRVTWDPLSASAAVKTDGASNSYYGDTIHPGPVGAFARGKFAASYAKAWLKPLDRLPSNIFETYTNQKVTGTALAAQSDGITLRVTCPNASSGLTLIREGDLVGLAVPSAGNTTWNGRWLCTAATLTYVDLACNIPGSYTGTINLSAAEQLFDNPLISVQTGGSYSGGGTVTNALPSGVSISIPASCTATATYPAHTDLNGVADGLGYWLDLDISLAANAQMLIWTQCHRSNVASSVYGRVQPGDIVQVGYDVEIVSCSGLYTSDFGATVAYTPPASGQVQIPVFSLYRSGSITAAHPNSAGRGSVMTGEWRVPTTGSVDTLDGQITLTAGASGATIRLRIGRLAVFAQRSALRANVDQSLDI